MRGGARTEPNHCQDEVREEEGCWYQGEKYEESLGFGGGRGGGGRSG